MDSLVSKKAPEMTPLYYLTPNEGISLPTQTGTVAIVTDPAAQSWSDPQARLALASGLPHSYRMPAPIRDPLSISVEDTVREYMRALSAVAWYDICKTTVAEVRRYSNVARLVEAMRVKLDFSPLISSIESKTEVDSAREDSNALTVKSPYDPLGVDWVKAIMRDGCQETSTDVFVNMIGGLEDLLNRHNFALLDRLLSSIDYRRISPEAMIAFVRVTYQARSDLQAWQTAVETIRDELTRRGFDGPRMLTGLSS
jgi:hypothetical protein